MRLAIVGAICAALLLAFTGVAGAATYCVNASGCSGISEPDLQTALNAAMASTTEADVVHVGDPGTPPGSGWAYSDGGPTANQVDIIGEGPSNTVLTNTASTVLFVGGAGSTISDLTVKLPNAVSNGIATSGSLSNVDVTSLDNGTHSQTGVVLLGTGPEHWSGGSIALPTSGTGLNTAIARSGSGGTFDLTDLAVSAAGPTLVASPSDAITLRRVSMTSGLGIINQGAHVTLDDVAYRATPQPAPGIFMITTPSGSQDATSDLNHVTAFGNGLNGTFGLLADDLTNLAATVNVRNSILRNFFFLINRSSSSSGGSANVNLSYSDIDLIHKLDTTTSPGSGATNVGPGMIDSDPLFTNPAAGDFSLKPGSPAIDAGDPAGLVAGDSATDMLGAPRISNGRQDMGALEVQVPPPVPPPAAPTPPAKDRLAPKLKLSKLPKSVKLTQLLKGIKFTVTTSEPSAVNATLAGSAGSVKLARSFNFTLAHKHLGLKSGKRRITLKVRKNILGHSRRFTVRLTVTATDASGNVSTIRRTIKVR